MSEVKRYTMWQDGSCSGPQEEGDWVTSEDFDRVTAERDAALLDLSEIKESLAYRGSLLCRIEGQRDALQQRLTAADELADVLEGLLQRVYDADLAARHQQPYNVSKLMDEIEEVLCQVNKVKINIPEGWKLVPVKPTEEMIHAIALGVHRDITTTEVWQELLDCAPAFEQADATLEP